MHSPVPELIPAELLLRAYRGGIFPMADHRNDREVYWVEPRERAIIPLDGFRLSKSLRKIIRQIVLPSVVIVIFPPSSPPVRSRERNMRKAGSATR